MWKVVNGHLTTSPLAELSTELVEDEALCSGVVGNGLGRVHDTPGLVAVAYLGCYPVRWELGGRGEGRGGEVQTQCEEDQWGWSHLGGWGYVGGGRGLCLSVLG